MNKYFFFQFLDINIGKNRFAASVKFIQCKQCTY